MPVDQVNPTAKTPVGLEEGLPAVRRRDAHKGRRAGRSPIERFLDRVEEVRESSQHGWVARCPAHDDRQQSLSVAEGEDGRVLVHCFAGCSYRAILDALGLAPGALFAPGTGASSRGPGQDSWRRGCTVAAYGAAKQLPINFLAGLGLTDTTVSGTPAVRIPYEDADGNEVAVRFRTGLSAEENGKRFCWQKGSRPHLYGLPRLAHARERGYVVLVEGESDCHTLWYHGFPAVGVPGATNWREERDAEQLAEIEEIYVVVEPDRGGEAVLDWLSRSSIRERARIVRLEGAKDPSELHLDDPGVFRKRFEAALAAAVAWEDAAHKGKSEAGDDGSPSEADSPANPAVEGTDLANAEFFAEQHGGRFRYINEERKWLVYDQGRWRLDKTGEVERAAKETARAIARLAADVDDLDKRKRALSWAARSQSATAIENIVRLARTEPGIAITADVLDRDPYLLACPNGTLDLHTGMLRSHDPADLISLGTDIPYEAHATCPRFERFLAEVFDGEPELPGFIKRAIGYSLTGDTREHCFFVCHGHGRNGKTTLIETAKRLVGTLAATASIESFVRSRHEKGVRNDLARLRRMRLVSAAESGDGRQLDAETVKNITGGDRIVCRFLYGEHFEYQPEFKLWLLTNNRPRISGDDDAIWARVKLIPFEVSFLGREDRELSAKLEAELPGILRWAVEGCLEWQRDGLGIPSAVERATADYRREEDVLGSFLTERCVVGEGRVDAGDFRAAYEYYCSQLGEQPRSAVAVGRELARRGIESCASGGRRFYRGLNLR